MTTETDPLIGREIDGYRIEKLLGRGGMARVYRAQDLRLGRYAAIKLIEPDARADPEYARRFEKEARAVAQLQHPHIVNLYRFGEVDGLYYMAMQYIEGVDLNWVLADYAADGELMPHEDVLRVTSQLAGALDYAHSRGVIHRDFKPSNVMLDKDGRAILTDFGLALVQAEGTRGEIFGTPNYIAPEQAVSSAGAVAQSDQYSLGVMLYEMLTGSVPFDGETAMDIALAHMTEPPPSPLERNPDLHPAFAEILERALQKELENRYPNCAALAADLERAVRAEAQAPTRPARVSLLTVSDQVKEFRAAHPLPPLPAPVVAGSPPKPAAPKPPPESTRPAPKPVATRARQPESRGMWRGVIVASVIVVVIGAVAVALLLGSRNPAAETPTPDLTTAVTQVARVSAPTSTPETPTATPTDTPTETPSPTPTVPTATPTTPPTVVVAMPTATQGATTYVLQIYRRGDESIVLVNRSPDPFPLAFLRLGDGEGAIRGVEWAVEMLEANACVVAIQGRGNPKLPDVACSEVGVHVTRTGGNRVWRETFTVYYNDQEARTCTRDDTEKGCLVPLAVR